MQCYDHYNQSHSVYPKRVGMFSAFSTWISRLGTLKPRKPEYKRKE
jgi:hypothetical protein